MSTYFLESFGPHQVLVHEQEVTYPVTRKQAEADLLFVRANRANYDSDAAWLRRVTYLEDIIAACDGCAS